MKTRDSVWKVFVMAGLGIVLAGCSEPTQAPASAAAGQEHHFTVADLARLGCEVKVTPRTTSKSVPFMGRIDAYGFSKGPACASTLISTLTQSPEYDEGTWAGLRASNHIFAEKHGYDLEEYSGELGEYSELDVFTRQGDARGFQYRVQAGGLIHSVTLISDSIEPDEAFEAVLHERL